MQAAELMPVELTVEPWAANKGIEGEAFDKTDYVPEHHRRRWLCEEHNEEDSFRSFAASVVIFRSIKVRR